ncbi:hypothetical protein IMZ48_26170 [Candidatus Bathyarchaeota archaeon]|nr:hypothetical protein [Candidatus Bathyarchaeota archaeon]
MSNINQSGTYRGLVIDRGLSNSSGGYLQLEVTMQATEKWDEENQVWTPFNFEDSEAQAYLNLVTSKEKENPVNCRQIMRAFGWDGMAFATLNNPDSPLVTQIQWRMSMETYNDVERCKVQGIEAYDAAPGRKVEKLDAAAVRAVDAKYAAILKNLGGGPKPKSAKPTAPAPVALAAPAAVPFTPDPTPSPSGTVSPTPMPLASPEPPKAKRGRPAKPPATPATWQHLQLAQEEAWATYAERAGKAGKTDLEVANTWTTVVKELYGSDEKVGEDWSGVYAEVCKRLGV